MDFQEHNPIDRRHCVHVIRTDYVQTVSVVLASTLRFTSLSFFLPFLRSFLSAANNEPNPAPRVARQMDGGRRSITRRA